MPSQFLQLVPPADARQLELLAEVEAHLYAAKTFVLAASRKLAEVSGFPIWPPASELEGRIEELFFAVRAERQRLAAPAVTP